MLLIPINNGTPINQIHKARRRIDWENIKERMCKLCLRKLPIEHFHLSYSNTQPKKRKSYCKQCTEFKRLQKLKGKNVNQEG